MKNGFLVVHQDDWRDDTEYFKVIVSDYLDNKHLLFDNYICTRYAPQTGVN